MTYTFRNRFRLGEYHRLVDAEVPEIKLADSADDGLVIVYPFQRKPDDPQGGFIFAVRLIEKGGLVSQTNELILQGDGYNNFDAAAAAGRRWRQFLTVALARECRTVDFGPDDSLTPVVHDIAGDDLPDLLNGIEVEVGNRLISDDPRLLVFPTEPTPKFVEFIAGTPTVKISGWLERFEERVRDARQRDAPPWNAEKTLAYRLIHLALGDTNRETRHIQLVTAIEVLLKEQKRDKSILKALDALCGVVDAWPDDTVKKDTKDILHGNKQDSISHAGQDQVAAMLGGTYGDMPSAEFFKHVYDLRSRLVHRAKKNKPALRS